MKLDRGVIVVGCGAVSDRDNWMVRNSLPKYVNSRQDLDSTCARGRVLAHETYTGTERLLFLSCFFRAH